MTEQEAEACVAYITKVWGIRSGSRWRLSEQGAMPDHRKQLLHFLGYVCDEVKLRVTQLYEEDLWTYTLFHEVQGKSNGEFLRLHHGELSFGKDGDEAQEERARQFAAKWLPFFRRGCWLMGRAIGATAQEKAQWCADFAAEELETWNVRVGADDVLDEAVLVHETQRFVAAFGIETWSRIEELEGHWRHYCGRVRGISIKWRYEWDGSLYYCVVNDSHNSAVYVPSTNQFGCSGGPSHAQEVMVRGLFCLGIEISQLSAHEKMELRLSMPREFWPKQWLEEEV